MRSGDHSVLRIAASPTPGGYLLPRLVAELSSQLPNVNVQLSVVGTEAEVTRALLSGSHDLGIAPLESQSLLSSLVIEHAYDEQVVFFAAQHHPLSQLRQIPLTALLPFRVVGPLGFPFWQELFRKLSVSGYDFSDRMNLAQAEALTRWIEGSNRDIGVHYSAAVERGIADGRLVPLDLDHERMSHRFYFMRVANVELPPAVQGFCTALIQRMALATF